jgi:hypothetical protein
MVAASSYRRLYDETCFSPSDTGYIAHANVLVPGSLIPQYVFQATCKQAVHLLRNVLGNFIVKMQRYCRATSLDRGAHLNL